MARNLTLHLTYGVFTMHVSPDIGEMTGANRKWNPPLLLHLKRGEERPGRSPVREELTFRNGGITLAGSLVKPELGPPWPAVVVIHGSGNQGRKDGFYARWGNYFARQGVAALIYDKRGVGDSTGDYEHATFDDLAGDAVAAVGALSRRPDIELDRLGLFGMSQGGWLAPLAASRTGEVRFLILDVGPAVTVRKQELDRVAYSMRADGCAESDIDQALDYTRSVFAAAYAGEGIGALLAQAADVAAGPWADYVSVVTSEADLEGWRLIRYDPAAVLSSTKIPLLALFGEEDTLVPPAENIGLMRRYLERAGNSDFTLSVIPGVGHDMETFGTLRGGEWSWPEHYWVWPRKSPALGRTITVWMRAHHIIP